MNFNSFFIAATHTSTGIPLPSYITDRTVPLYEKTLNLLVVDKQAQLSACSPYTLHEFKLSPAQRLATLIGLLASILLAARERTKLSLIKTFYHQLVTGSAFVLIKTKKVNFALEEQPKILDTRSSMKRLPLVLQNAINSFLSYKDQAYFKQSSHTMLQTSYVALNNHTFHPQLLEIVEIQRHVIAQIISNAGFDSSNQRLKRLTPQFPNLTQISFTPNGHNKKFIKEDINFQPIVQNFPYLTSINVGALNNVTHTSLEYLAQNYPKLKSINLSSSCTVNDIGIEALAQKCPGLTSINVQLCSRLTDRSLRALAQNCQHLSSINLSGCHSMTSDGLRTLTENCHDLISINLKGWSRLLDTDLEVVAKNCPNLTTINLEFCTQLTDNSLESLTKNCPNFNPYYFQGLPTAN